MTVLAGYVPDATGYAVVGEAIRAAALRRTTLTVVNLVGPAGFASPSAAEQPDLEQLAERLRGSGVTHDVRQVHLRGSDVATALLGLAGTLDAGLLVLGQAPRSRMTMLGSTVLLDAACPVLVVHPPRER